jgi:hypothetical protein
MRRDRLVAALVVGAFAAACGLDLVGAGLPGSTPDKSSLPPDGAATDDASPDAPGNDGATDADAKPPCPSVTFTHALSVLDAGADGGWIIMHDSSNGDHPKIDPSPEGAAVSLIGAGSSVGGIYRPPAPLKAFDLSFRYIVQCPSGLTSCADGISAIWLEATDAGAGALYAPASGATLGVPPSMRGSAFSLDTYQDPAPADPAIPSFSILAIDPTKAPGSYDWHTTKGSADAGFVGAHDVTLTVRKGSLTAKLDGATVLTGPVATDFEGWMGVVASSGGTMGLFFVRNFSMTLYGCDDP